MYKVIAISIALTLVTLLSGPTAFADSGFMLAPVTDTYITVHPELGGPDSNHGNDQGLIIIGTTGYNTYPLIKFDLSILKNYSIMQSANADGAPTLTLNVAGGWWNCVYSCTQTIQAFAILKSWEEYTVTWNNFGPGPICGVNVDCTPLSTITVTVVQWNVVKLYLPLALVQKWMDHPETNYGILLYSTTAECCQDIGFASRDSQRVMGPEVTFITYPPTPMPPY